jgi:hypothetical protein
MSFAALYDSNLLQQKQASQKAAKIRQKFFLFFAATYNLFPASRALPVIAVGLM